MAAQRKLKVFRTAIGFHDAYVATTSKKAALDAWGAATDLFAIGSAEQVTDPAAMEAALARPGEVVRLSRGSAAQHLAAAGQTRRTAPRRQDDETLTASASPRAPGPRKSLRPSRDRLDAAERTLAVFEKDAQSRQEALRRKEMALVRQKKALETELERTRDRYRHRIEEERSKHAEALARWQSLD